jgi:hypothetical protein
MKALNLVSLSLTLAGAAVVSLGAALPAQAFTQYYGGDFNGVEGWYNQAYNSLVFEDFSAAAPITVTGLFSNNLTDFTGVTQAEWQIRTGMSASNGGTTLFSGTSSATQVATGRSGFGRSEYTINVGGLAINLTPGTYWFAIAPVSSSGTSYVTTTSGANGVGSSPSSGALRVSSSLQSLTPTFSMGVVAQDPPVSAVPVPPQFLATAIGAGIGALKLRKGKKDAGLVEA